MRYLTIWQKLFVAFAVLAVSNVMALGFMIAERNEQIAALDKERKGLAYLAPLRELRALVPEARRVNAAASTSPEATAQRSAIELLIKRIDDLDLQIGPDLKTTADFIALKKAWEQLKTSASDPRASAELMSKIDFETRSLHFLAADTSGLVLDSALDTYYLMDASVVKLTTAADRLIRLAAPAQPSTTEPPSSAAGRDDTMATLVLLKDDVAGIESDLKVATETNPALKAPLQAPSDQFQRAANDLLAATDADAIRRGHLSESQASAAPLMDALARTFTLYDVAVATLDKRLAERRDDLASARTRAITYVVIAAVLGMALALWMGHSIALRLRRLANGVRAATIGGAREPIESSPDEIGTLALAVDDLIRSLAAIGASAPTGEQVAGENGKLKILVADLSLENQRLRESGGQST